METSSAHCLGTHQRQISLGFRIAIALWCMLVGSFCHAAVHDVLMADVAPRSFATVWTSDQPILSAGVRVFADAAATQDITNTLTITVDSVAYPPALDKGVAKVTVAGVQPDATYFVQTETVTSAGTVHSPAFGSLLSVHTPLASTRNSSVGQLIVNDLITQNVAALDGISSAAGTLFIVRAEIGGLYPVSAFVGEGGLGNNRVMIDLNNLFNSAGSNAEIADLQVLRLTEFRGAVGCQPTQHALVRFRKAPSHEELPVITELESGVSCNGVDTVCDNQINILDSQFVLNAFNSSLGTCQYHPELDVVIDGQIDVMDVQQVLNYFGTTLP